MNIFDYFNTALGSCLIIVIIAIDYLRKYNTDNFQRKLLMIMLTAVFLSATFDFIGLTIERNYDAFIWFFGLEDVSSAKINTTLYYVWSIYLIARNCCYYYAAVFVDYFAHGNITRTKKFLKIVSIFLIIYAVSVIINIKYEFYFFVSIDNAYRMGPLYMLQVLISYLPIIMILVNISLAPKHIKRTQVLLTIFFVILSAFGAAIDIILRTTNLVWPCVTGAILYMYFFIIRSNSKIDTLTGIGNRNSFYEYVFSLSTQQTKNNYLFLKIDIKRFSAINSAFGHLEGDNALREIAAIIKGCIRHTDFAARIGGDEFIIVTTADNEIHHIINRINETIEKQNKKNVRPFKLFINYDYDIYSANTGWHIQDFLSNLEDRIHKKKANNLNNGEDNV